MENKDESGFRNRFDKEGDAEDVKRKLKSSDDGDKLDARDVSGSDVTDSGSEEGSDEGVLTEAEKRELELKKIDETEISDFAETTPLYRRAVSDFDPKETRPQLAEHWEYRDEEYERDGYF